MGPVSGSTKAPSGSPRILAPNEGEGQPGQSPAVRANPVKHLVDRLAGEVVLRHAHGRRVLDLGHGAPDVTAWVTPRAGTLRVVDAVDLDRDAEIRLPFADGAIDLVYSLRTLPHLGHDEDSSDQAARSAIAEVARVLAVGGTALLQLDNPRSLWGAYHGIRNPMTAVERGPLMVESDHGLTRFDTLSRFAELLPPTLDLVGYHGIRVLVTLPHTLSIPIVGRLLERLEWFVRDRAPFRAFGAHLLVVLRRIEPTLPALPAGSGH